MENEKKKSNKEKAPKAHVSELKKKIVKELTSLSNKYNTIMILDILGVPSSRLQIIRKKLKNEAVIQIIKKRLAMKIFEDNEKLKPLVPWLNQSSAILFSNIDPFELAINIEAMRSPAKAKPGQIANEDLAVEAGPTELMAGPALSDLSKVGLKVKVEGGKIAIKERKVLAKKGEKISVDVADILSKLDVTPFSVGLEPIAAYDTKSKKAFSGLKIDKNAKLNDLKSGKVRAIAFAIQLKYPTKETISSLLAKAEMEFSALSSKINQTQ